MPSVPQTGTTESGEHCRLQFVQVGCLVTGFTRQSIKCGQLMTGHVAFTEENIKITKWHKILNLECI